MPFAFTVLAPGQRALAGDLLDSTGHRIGGARTDECTCHKHRRFHTVLTAKRYRLTANGANTNTCIALATGRRQPTECEDFAGEDGTVDAFVSCNPRVAAVYGMTGRKVRRIEVELSGHRHVNAAMRFFGHNRVFLALLPRSA